MSDPLAPGETDLGVLLRSLRPVLDETEFGYGVLPAGSQMPPGISPLGLFEEDEGTTIIAPSAQLAAAGIAHSPGWAKIGLRVHSALAAVGLTAAIATALAKSGISANVVAGYYHDHVFVPWDRRHDAMAVLAQCTADAGTPAH